VVVVVVVVIVVVAVVVVDVFFVKLKQEGYIPNKVNLKSKSIC